jgi:hypothetical protein
MIFNRFTFSRTAFCRITLRKMTFNKLTFSRTAFGIITLSRMTFRRIIAEWYQNDSRMIAE